VRFAQFRDNGSPIFASLAIADAFDAVRRPGVSLLSFS
jgi:hypothetical protein